eukprot:3030539-Pleurochrysis_carterae.AAC.2
MAAATALEKMGDPKIAICDKLSSQDGANSYNLNADAHEATLGAHNVNGSFQVRAHAHAHQHFIL